MTDDEQRPAVQSSLELTLDQLIDFGIGSAVNRSLIREGLPVDSQRNYVFMTSKVDPDAKKALKEKGWIFDKGLLGAYLTVLPLLAAEKGLRCMTYPLNDRNEVGDEFGPRVHIVGDTNSDLRLCSPPLAIRERFGEIVRDHLGGSTWAHMVEGLIGSERLAETLFLKNAGVSPLLLVDRSTNVYGENLLEVLNPKGRVEAYSGRAQ